MESRHQLVSEDDFNITGEVLGEDHMKNGWGVGDGVIILSLNIREWSVKLELFNSFCFARFVILLLF